MKILSDIEIAQSCTIKPITDIAQTAKIDEKYLELYGKYKAKVSCDLLTQTSGKNGKLILVTAINPTPAGEGKTTTTIGLADGLQKIGKKVAVALREPSLGPVFGVKGGATGGGYAQVLPMEDINLHFTGDLHAIGTANNLLSAMLDNHIQQGNSLNIDSKRIVWRRCMDMNDRQLRNIVSGLGGTANGVPHEDGFDITAASEVMAVLCLAEDITDLKARLGRIVVAYSLDGKPVTAHDLKADGAMTVLLKDAIKPNLVQTIEGTPVFIHGGPFANIAHGCNSVIATRMAMHMTVLLKDAIKPNLVQTIEGTPVFIHGGPFANIAHGCNSVIATRMAMHLGNYAVTEAGFGADLGAEKFLDIKCRAAGLTPSAVVIVATVRSLKNHGGVEKSQLDTENLEALEQGLPNLLRHVSNITNVYKLPCIVAINSFHTDTPAELELVAKRCRELNVNVVLSEVWAKGGEGGRELAEEVVRLCEQPNSFNFAYDVNSSIEKKLISIAKNIYQADDIVLSDTARKQIAQLDSLGFGKLPICMAKTQYSFSDKPKLLGAPTGFKIAVNSLRVSAGAGFIVVLTGDIMTMPGLPKNPSAERIDIDENGVITGLF